MNKQFYGVPIKEYFSNLASKRVDTEEDNPDYRCFKGKIHIYPLTKMLFLISIGIWLLFMGVTFPWSVFVFWIPLVYFLITLYALRQRNALCMWPSIIHCATLVLMWCSATIVLFSTALFSMQRFLDTFGLGYHQAFVSRLLIVFGIKTLFVLIGVYLIYQFYAFNLCRQYFDAIRNVDANLSDPEELRELQSTSDKVQSIADKP